MKFSFCATCGSRLPRHGRDPDVAMIPAGSLDQEAPIKPQARIVSGSRTRWSCEGDPVPAYPDYVRLYIVAKCARVNRSCCSRCGNAVAFPGTVSKFSIFVGIPLRDTTYASALLTS